jgi:hypothetical protein
MFKSRRFVAASVVMALGGLAAAESAFSRTGAGHGAPGGERLGPSTTISGDCSTRKIGYASSDETGLSTSSPDFVDVPGMALTFETARSGCVLVSYSAVVLAAGADRPLLNVRAMLDGAFPSFPGEVQLEGDSQGEWADARAFNFVFIRVPAGTHTVKMQWRSADFGIVWTHERTMLVSHS